MPKDATKKVKLQYHFGSSAQEPYGIIIKVQNVPLAGPSDSFQPTLCLAYLI